MNRRRSGDLRTAAALVLASCWLFACQSSPAAESGEADYVFVFLDAGPRESEMSADEKERVFAAHAANLNRLAAEGGLLLAGPLSAPRSDPNDRGMFVFDLDDVGEALLRTAGDPAVRAEALSMRAYPWRATTGIRKLRDLERSLDEASAGTGRGVRPYVLVSVDRADEAARALAPLFADGRVLFFGRFGGSLGGHAMFALDAVTTDVARELLAPIRAADGSAFDWELHPWFSTSVLVDLPLL